MYTIPLNASTILPMYPDSDPNKLARAFAYLAHLPAKEWTCHYSQSQTVVPGREDVITYHRWDFGFLLDDVVGCVEYLNMAASLV